jgi:hypothetical protein
LKIRWSDFTTLTRQLTLTRPTHQDSEIYQGALQLFEKVWPVGKPVRLIGVGVSGFGVPRQLGLWEADHREQEQLQSTLDDLRERFGDKILRRGSDLAGRE